MKQFILLFILIADVANFTISQPICTDANNKRIMEWDSSYEIITKEFRAISEYEIPYQYVIQKNSKVVAEYFRHDDSSYLFLRYDTTHKIMQRGLIKTGNDTFKIKKYTIQIPVRIGAVGTSNELLKDTVIYDTLISYQKEGIWKETDSWGMIWKGEYKNGLRQGEWEEGILLKDQHEIEMARMYDNFRPYVTHFFRNGAEVPIYADSILFNMIKGSWIYGAKLSSNTIIYERTKHRPQYDFKSNTSVIVYQRPQYPKTHLDMEKKSVFWKQNTGRIEIFENGKQTILQMLKFTGDRMILRIVQQDL